MKSFHGDKASVCIIDFKEDPLKIENHDFIATVRSLTNRNSLEEALKAMKSMDDIRYSQQLMLALNGFKDATSKRHAIYEFLNR